MKKKPGSHTPKIASLVVGERGNIKLNINDESTLHHPQESLILDIRDAACMFDAQYGDMLIKHDHEEFNKLTHTHHALLSDQRRIRELVPSFKNQDRVYPLIALSLLDDVINNHLINNSAFSTESIKDNIELIAPYIDTPPDTKNMSEEDRDEMNLIVAGMFQVFAAPLSIIMDFISDSPWNVFAYNRTIYTITLNKEMDYRIQDWMRLKKEGKI